MNCASFCCLKIGIRFNIINVKNEGMRLQLRNSKNNRTVGYTGLTRLYLARWCYRTRTDCLQHRRKPPPLQGKGRTSFLFTEMETCGNPCPNATISMGSDHMEINKDLCINCGICVNICPVSATEQ